MLLGSAEVKVSTYKTLLSKPCSAEGPVEDLKELHRIKKMGFRRPPARLPCIT
jgi:hypothetical protein